jgi:hypothetical protein
MRAQVTLFIILGILILLSAGIYFMAIGTSWRHELDAKDKDIVMQYVESCLSQATDNGLRAFGLTGGEFTPRMETISGSPVYYKQLDGIILVPAPLQASQYLAGEICHEFRACINFSILAPITIDPKGEPTCTVRMSKNAIDVNADYPMSVYRDATSSNLRRFHASLNKKVMTTLVVASDFARAASASNAYLDPRALDYYCAGCMVCQDKGIVKVFQYDSFSKPPSFTYRFGTDDEILKGCTQMRGHPCD